MKALIFCLMVIIVLLIVMVICLIRQSRRWEEACNCALDLEPNSDFEFVNDRIMENVSLINKTMNGFKSSIDARESFLKCFERK